MVVDVSGQPPLVHSKQNAPPCKETSAIRIQRRLKKICRPNDKLAKAVATIQPNMFKEDVERFGQYRENLLEAGRKNQGIHTTYTLKVKGNVDALDQFDFAVLCVCISEQVDGNNFVTADRIFRGLTGGKSHGNTRMTKSMATAIVASVEKLMTTLIEIDSSKAQKLKYDLPKKIVATILPAAYEIRTVNGQEVTTIHFLEESPLLIFARAKRQLLNHDVHLLQIPNINNTRRVVALKFYTIGRVLEIIGHNLRPTITFDDVFQKCGLADGTKRQKQEARRTIETVLNHLKAEKIIDNFTFEREGGKFRAIKIQYSKPS